MSRIKIAFLAPEFLPTWGGVGIYSVELLRELSKYSNLEIHVITPKRGKNYNKTKILKEFDNKIFIHNITKANDTFFYNFKFQLALLREFPKLHKKCNFDILHSANLVHMPDIFLKIFNKINIPTVCTVHTTIDSQSKVRGFNNVKGIIKKGEKVEILSKLTYPYIKIMQNYYLKNTDAFIAVSNYTKNLVPKLENISLIYNGINLQKFMNFDKKQRIENPFNFLDNIKLPKILFVGRLLSMKGLDTYIKSIKQVLKKKKAYFIFAGQGNIKKWKKLMTNIPEKYYKFLGYVEYEKIHYLYNKSDIFVLPSLTESFPLTVMEAMASKLPIIATNVGGIPELIENNKNGFLVEPLDYKNLSDKIIKLIENKKLKNKFIKSSLNSIKNKFTAKKKAEKTYKLYKKIIKKWKNQN
jgi:glycosyltransferase involved in cell wall biosynthesis